MIDIPINAIRIDHLEVGQYTPLEEKETHQKVIPETIMAFVKVGSYEIKCDGKKGVAHPGEFFLTPPGKPMTIIHHRDHETGKMHAIYIHTVFTLFDAVEFTDLMDLPLIVGGAAGKEMGEIIQILLDLQNTKKMSVSILSQRVELGFKALRIICQVSSSRPRFQEVLDGENRIIPVLQFIAEHFKEITSLNQLAAVANLSRSRFCHLFTLLTQTTPMAYLKQVRMVKAQQLLLRTDQNIAEVSENVGFTNQFHFSREFKKETGYAPLKYRKTQRELPF